MNECETPPSVCAAPVSLSQCYVKWHSASVGSSQSSIKWELMKTNVGFCFTSLLEISLTVMNSRFFARREYVHTFSFGAVCLGQGPMHSQMFFRKMPPADAIQRLMSLECSGSMIASREREREREQHSFQCLNSGLVTDWSTLLIWQRERKKGNVRMVGQMERQTR